ncbi:putative Monooxygenase flavin-binding family protein-like protein [Seiridium cardinale]|uniref:Monooxygenase flavin-binding family protein-like protein n=1 Tax=Seiridium cardinale TaxID=138064 RepID=A0ABR2Y2L2_9PEZI
MAPSQTHVPFTEEYDIIIIGAGISGLNCAYRLQTQLSSLRFAILESRNDVGGTWDLFKYPGVRSDSDLHTYGFSWHPWPHEKPIAEKSLIVSYLKEVISTHGLDKYLNFRHKVLSADWSSKTNTWRLEVESDGQRKTYHTKFMVLGAGYYDYNQPLQVEIPGLKRFQGEIIHPQFWPEDYDYTGKRIVIIGSGATAITMLPNLAEKAAHVTMLQRSATYVVSSRQSWSGLIPRKLWPRWLLSYYERWWFMVMPRVFVAMCRWFPDKMKSIVQKGMLELLPSRIALDPHFNPKYYPWQQRLCFSPDGDFFKALHTPRADVVTSVIKTVTEDGIELEIGKKLEADLIITATGLQMQFGGGIPLRVDGELVDVGKKFIWNGAMIQDVPNMFFMVGYTNASWTLGADDTALIICRLLKHMSKNKAAVSVPRLPRDPQLEQSSAWDLTSTYVKLAEERLPKAGNKGPWRPRGRVLHDHVHARWGNITNGLQFLA